MYINWYGQTCFKIAVQKRKDGQVVILTDPFGKETGLRPPRIEADVLLLSTDLSKGVAREKTFLIEGPGEYEIRDVYIESIPVSEGKGTIYTIEGEEIKVCYLGILKQTELSSKQLERIGNVDILMVPIGGENTLDAKGAIKIMSQIEPKITIPMYYKIPGLKVKLEGLDKFLGVLGIKKLEPLPKLSIKKKAIPQDEAKIVVLSP